MRKVKVTVNFEVPSWNFCNCDIATRDGRYSKELCKFCIRSDGGYYCQLYEEYLANDRTFVYKPECCKRMTAGFKEEVQPKPEIDIDPQDIISEAIKAYNQLRKDLHKQGYPPNMADSLATKYMLNSK